MYENQLVGLSTCCSIITITDCLLVCLLLYTLSHALITPSRGHRFSGLSPALLPHYVSVCFVLFSVSVNDHFNVVQASFTVHAANVV